MIHTLLTRFLLDFSSNSEAFASELLVNSKLLVNIFLVFTCMVIGVICSNLQQTRLFKQKLQTYCSSNSEALRKCFLVTDNTVWNK